MNSMGRSGGKGGKTPKFTDDVKPGKASRTRATAIGEGRQ